MQIIAVANQKGGVGKTDLCVNLSTTLAKLRKKVLLIDMDPQGNSTDYLGKFNAEATTLDLLLDEKTKLSDIVQKTSINNLDMVPSNRNLAKAEVELINDVGMQFKLKGKLENKYDYVFIDTPPSLGLLTINALTAANKVLIPIQVHYFALDGVAKLINTIKSIKKQINPKIEIYGFVLTMFDKRNKLSGEIEEKVREAFGQKVFRTAIPINVKLTESPSHHKPISLYAGWSKGAEAYERLGKEFLEKK